MLSEIEAQRHAAFLSFSERRPSLLILFTFHNSRAAVPVFLMPGKANLRRPVL